MAQQRWLFVSDDNFIRFIQCALSEVKAAVKLNKINKFLSLRVSGCITMQQNSRT
jgi:hypothetical protein